MKGLKGWTGLLVLMIVGISAGQCFAAEARGVTDDAIKMGLVIAMTSPSAVMAKDYIPGIKHYYDYINEKGGINGRKISLLIEDDQNEVPKSVAGVNKLIHRDKVLTIMTTGGSPQTIANENNIEKFKISNVPNGMMTEFWEPYKAYTFPMGCPYEAQYQGMVDYIFNDLGAKKDARIGVVYTKKEYGILGLNATRERVAAYGGKLACELVLPIESVDASSQVLALQNNNVDYVITCLVIPALVPLLKTYEKYNYDPKVTLGFGWTVDPMVIGMVGPAAKSYIGVNFLGTWTSDEPGVKLARELVEKNNHKISMSSQYLNGMGTTMLFVEAIKRAGRDLNPDTLKDAFETFSSFATGGILPPVTYTPKSHKPSDMMKFFKADVPTKSFVQLTDYRTPKQMK